MGLKDPLRRGVVMDPCRVRTYLHQSPSCIELRMPVAVSLELVADVRAALLDALRDLGWSVEGASDVALVSRAFDLGLLPSLRCPWGRGGDLLYAREPWNQVARHFRYSPHERIGDESAGVFLSPESMPEAAARLWLRIRTVSIEECADGSAVWVLLTDKVPSGAGAFR